MSSPLQVRAKAELEKRRRRSDGDDDAEARSLLEWTEAHRYIRDKEGGEVAGFSLREYPWLEDVYRLIDGHFRPEEPERVRESGRSERVRESGRPERVRESDTGRRVVIRKAAQIGATELALNLSFWVLDGRGSVFYALPPGPTQGNFAHARVDPAIGVSPHIGEMAGHIDNVGLKTFRGGFNFYIRGTQVPKGDPSRAAQLSEAPADLAVIDEFDRVPAAAVPLIRDRLGDSRMAWELDLSTPTYPDLGIDYEYQGTTQHEPQILCGGKRRGATQRRNAEAQRRNAGAQRRRGAETGCGAWHWLDWELVRGPVPGDPQARLICPSCGKVIERAGMWEEERVRWRPKHPGREVLGFWIPKLVSERVGLDELWERSRAKRDIDIQAFWNSDLGLAYEPKGARLTRELIGACVNPLYESFPHRARWTAMGVDVGLELHYWIKERRPDGRERAVGIGSVPTWEDLDGLMARYGVQRCVVDDRPELTADRQFQDRFKGKVWLGLEVDSLDAELARWKKKEGRVVIERTKGLNEASAKVELGIDELPADWETVPDLVAHLTANIKAKRVRPDGSTVYHFPQTSKPDHLHHAKEFCEVAFSVLPPDPGEEEQRGEDEVPAAGKGQYLIPGSLRGRL